MSVEKIGLTYGMDDEGELDDCDISTYDPPAKYAEIDAERGVLRIGFDNGGVDGETRIPMNEIPMNSDMAMLIRRLARAQENTSCECVHTPSQILANAQSLDRSSRVPTHAEARQSSPANPANAQPESRTIYQSNRTALGTCGRRAVCDHAA